MTPEQEKLLLDLFSEVKAIHTQIKWVMEDVENMKHKLDELKILVDINQSSAQQQEHNWKLERF